MGQRCWRGTGSAPGEEWGGEGAPADQEWEIGSAEREERSAAAAAKGSWLQRDERGRVYKLHTERWRQRGTRGRVLEDTDRCEFVLRSMPPQSLRKGNLESCTMYESEVVALIDEYSKELKVEWQDEVNPSGGQVRDKNGRFVEKPNPEFVHLINPWGATPKPGSDKVRPYMDCTGSGLNEHLHGWQMRMPAPEHALQVMRRGGYMGKRDWTAGFHVMIMGERSRRLLGFRHPATGRIGRFVVQPFGSSQAPGRFWELASEFLRIAAEECERRGLGGVTFVGYCDDLAIFADTHDEVQRAFQVLDELGEELGIEWATHKDVGREVAAQRMTFCGIDLCCEGTPYLEVAEEKVARYIGALGEVTAAADAGRLRRGALNQVVGQLAFCARACRWGRGYLHHLYKALGEGSHPEERIDLTNAARADLGWWMEVLGTPTSPWRGRTQWSAVPWEMVKGTHYHEQGGDAAGEADLGWGATWGYERAAGKFEADELDLHISWKELLAIERGLELWEEDYTGYRVLVWTDNLAAAAAINNGTTRSPEGISIIRRIAQRCAARGIELRAKHIQGRLNEVNDGLSRFKEGSKTSTSNYKFVKYEQVARREWGRLAEIDMYSGESNVQPLEDRGRGTANYTASDPVEDHAAALRGRWLWANPPFLEAGRALEMIDAAWREDPWGTRALVVIPQWEGRWWWRRFVQRRRAPFRIVQTYPAGTEGLFWRTGARVHQGRTPDVGHAAPFGIVVVAIGGQAPGGGAARSQRQGGE